jgi:2-methylcitrate dehydratase PrpD
VPELTAIRAPQTGLEGKFSIYHAAAVALVAGAAGEPQFADAAVRDPRIAAVRERVTIAAEPAIRKLEAHVAVTLRDGRKLERHVEHALGTVQRPMRDADLEEKFRSLTADVLQPAQVDTLIRACWQLDTLADVGEIARAAAAT